VRKEARKSGAVERPKEESKTDQRFLHPSLQHHLLLAKRRKQSKEKKRNGKKRNGKNTGSES
jgi:hypothetical protein